MERGSGRLSNAYPYGWLELGKVPEKITLLMGCRAVAGENPLLRLDTHTNPACGAGDHIQLFLAEYDQRVQQKAEQEMDAIPLADIMETCHHKVKKAGCKITSSVQSTYSYSSYFVQPVSS